LSAGLGAFDNQRLKIRSGTINRCGKTSSAGAKNDYTVVTFLIHPVSVT
jgi:hypothetical protein